MKFFYVLVALFLTTSGLPAPKANWDLVSAKAEEIQALFMSSIGSVRNISSSDNPSIGQDIGYLLDIKIGEGIILGTGVRRQIDQRTLTPATANDYFTQLAALIQDLETEMGPYVVQLTPIAQAQIAYTVTFWKAMDIVLAAELLDALTWEPTTTTEESLPTDGVSEDWSSSTYWK